MTESVDKNPSWLSVGDPSPTFSLQDDQGNLVESSSLVGNPYVLYFYPRDDTPGCTIEACRFRDRRNELLELGAHVFGVSPDSVESHVAFREKFELNFPLLADTERELAMAFGAWREKTRSGKTMMGIHRSTFLVDQEGIIRNAWTNVDVNVHDQEVIDALKDLLN